MVDVLNINDVIDIPVGEISFSAVRSSGAGGQNVNKVATAIHLRFDSAASPTLPDYVKERLVGLGDRRITPNGVVIIKAQEHRTQERNRQALLTARLLLVRGRVESRDSVIHVIAGQLVDHSRTLEKIAVKSRDFH